MHTGLWRSTCDELRDAAREGGHVHVYVCVCAGSIQRIGDPTEVALRVFTEKVCDTHTHTYTHTYIAEGGREAST